MDNYLVLAENDTCIFYHSMKDKFCIDKEYRIRVSSHTCFNCDKIGLTNARDQCVIFVVGEAHINV